MIREKKYSKYTGLPYGKKLYKISKIRCDDDVSPVIKSLLIKHPKKNLLNIIADYVDYLKIEYKECIEKRNYAGVELVARKLGYEVIGRPAMKNYKYGGSFIGCQYRVGIKKK